MQRLVNTLSAKESHQYRRNRYAVAILKDDVIISHIPRDLFLVSIKKWNYQLHIVTEVFYRSFSRGITCKLEFCGHHEQKNDVAGLKQMLNNGLKRQWQH